jgi:NADH-quinone oxidoreductase subunit G
VSGDLGKGDFVYPIKDFYLTNPIARASVLMSKLSAQVKARNSNRIAAE